MSLGISNHKQAEQAEIKRKVEEFLANGGKIQKLDTTERVRVERLNKLERKSFGIGG